MKIRNLLFTVIMMGSFTAQAEYLVCEKGNGASYTVAVAQESESFFIRIAYQGNGALLGPESRIIGQVETNADGANLFESVASGRGNRLDLYKATGGRLDVSIFNMGIAYSSYAVTMIPDDSSGAEKVEITDCVWNLNLK